MVVRFKKVKDNAVIPSYAKKGDAGLDLTATSEKIVEGDGYAYIEYGVGLAMEIPEGYVGLIYPRSSLSNTGLLLSNSVGVVDSGYRGEVTCRFKYIKDAKKYNIGDRVAQLIVTPIPNIEISVVEELSDSERGAGGYGSTGV